MDNSTAKVKKDTKRKIKAEFDRTPLKERLKAKFLNFYFFQNVGVKLFRFVFLVGIAYVVLYPFFTKVAGSFMAPEDFQDATVRLIPKNWSVDIYEGVWTELKYMEAFTNTLLLSLACALLQTFTCCFIAYGVAKYKFKGNGLVFMLIMMTMIVPHKTLMSAMSMKFTYFDVFGIVSFLSGGASISEVEILGYGVVDFFNGLTHGATESLFTGIDEFLAGIHILNNPVGIKLTDTIWPMIILSVTGLAFKNGLYIFMLRQFFRGIPDSLEESAYIDGSGDFRTFIQIIIPMSVPMMITVFLFAFCWQWTDNFYINLFFSNLRRAPTTLPALLRDEVFNNVITGMRVADLDTNVSAYTNAIRNTLGLMIILPLVVLYSFMQRYLVEGIERSGLTAE